MNAMLIQQQVDDIKSLIKSSRDDVADSQMVDISPVEQKMSHLFDAVNSNPQLTMDVDVAHIADSLADLMNDLDELENDLTDQNSVIHAELDAAAAGSAAATYNASNTN
jgi:hypothetical protein